MKKRVFALALCLIMCLGLIPTALAASDLDVAEDAIEDHIKSVLVDNDTTEESLTYALQKLIPEGNSITVTVQLVSKTNATTEKRGSVTFNYYLHDPAHHYTSSGYYHVLRIPVASESQDEINMIEGDVAATSAAMIDYFATTKVDSSDIFQQMLTFQKAVSGSVVNGSTATWPGVDFDVSVKQGYIRGVLHLSFGAQVRKVKLDAVINADGSVTVKEPKTASTSAPTPSTPPTLSTPAPSIPATGTAYPSTQAVELDGKKVEFQMYALKDASGNPTNYVKVRDLALALGGTKAQFSVEWDGAVNLAAGSAYVPNGSENATPFSGEWAYTLPAKATNVNGAASDLQAIYLVDDAGGGYTYYQLRDLGRKLGFNVDWSAERGVYIETDKPYSGDK